jgi:hypothetical protein
VRLDPMMLPVRFTASDAGADQRVRLVELNRERVVLRRQVRGMRMAVNVPVASFLGVALRLVTPAEDTHPRILLSLEHRDPALCVPLADPVGDDVIAEWQLWARVFGLPLLVSDSDGMLREPFRRLGAVRLGARPSIRRRRCNAISRRRPSMPLRRRRRRLAGGVAVHRGEREIIARN